MNAFTYMFAGYLLLMMVIGVYFSKKMKGMGDFLVAGRKLNLTLTTATLMATWTGAAAITGYTGWCYYCGYSMLWIAFATTPSLIIIGLLFARKLRKLALYTVPDLLKLRYDKKTSGVSAVLIAIYCIGLVSVNIKGGATVMSTVFGWDISYAMLLVAAIIIAYTTLGGLWAVAWTDLIQFLILSIGLVVVVPFTLKEVGGWSVLHATLAEMDPAHLRIFEYAPYKTILAWFIIIYASNFIAPDIYQRMYAAKNERTARLAIGITGMWDTVLTMIALLLGMAAFVIFSGEIEGDMALPMLINKLFPGVFGAFVMVAIMAVVMSTADSLLVVASGTFVEDFYKGFINPKVSEEHALKLIRVMTVVSGLIALALGYYFESIMDGILFASSVYAAGLFIPIMSAFYWKRGTKEAAFISALLGGGITIAWRIIYGAEASIDPVLPGIAVSIVSFVVISFLTKMPEEEKLKPFENI